MSAPKLLIGSDWLDTPDKRPVVDPYTGQTIAQMPQADAALLDRAIGVAHQAFAATRQQPPFERANVLNNVSAAIEKWRTEFVEAMVGEAGKPVTLADAEVTRAVATFAFAAQEAKRDTGQTIAIDAMAAGKGHSGLVKRFPIGVIYGITPFNYPLNLVAHKVAPAIATGNTMLLKPAPRTPLSALLLGEVLLSAGMTPGQVNILACPNELAGKPIDDPRVKMVSFTGSPKVGWPIKQQAAKQKVTLELGGNAGVIVCEDADLDNAIPLIAGGAFAYAGQSCISVQRAYVHESIYGRFKERLLAHVKDHVKTGDPRDQSVINGPIIDQASMERLLKWIQDAGTSPLCGGKQAGPCLEPTILENVDPTRQISCNEAFGPMVTLDRYSDFEQALAQVNASPFGLQAGVFTRDLARAHAAFARLDVGGVMINQVPTFRVENMPYGGIKDSGFGREGLRYAMDDMTEPKLLVINHHV